MPSNASLGSQAFPKRSFARPTPLGAACRLALSGGADAYRSAFATTWAIGTSAGNRSNDNTSSGATQASA